MSNGAEHVREEGGGRKKDKREEMKKAEAGRAEKRAIGKRDPEPPGQ